MTDKNLVPIFFGSADQLAIEFLSEGSKKRHVDYSTLKLPTLLEEQIRVEGELNGTKPI